MGKINKDGIFLEQLETNPAQFLPEVTDSDLGGEVVKVTNFFSFLQTTNFLHDNYVSTKWYKSHQNIWSNHFLKNVSSRICFFPIFIQILSHLSDNVLLII